MAQNYDFFITYRKLVINNFLTDVTNMLLT